MDDDKQSLGVSGGTLDSKEEIQYQGIEEIGAKLKASSEKINFILATVNQKMKHLSENQILVGEMADSIFSQYQAFSVEFPSYVREIEKYSQMMYDTVQSFQESDQKLEMLSHEIEVLDDVGQIGQ